MLIVCLTMGPGLFSSALAAKCDPPPFITAIASPMVMLVMSRDHKLYYEAYNDAQDLTGDGRLNVGYDHSIDYYGFFDPHKCYTYQTTGTARFNPVRITADKYCGGSGEWSGNFLNWLSMSRMDVLKKVLYGGERLSDSSSETILKGVFVPQDAHSWGKEYEGTDTRNLTPFNAPEAGKRHLFCMTSTSAGQEHKIRVAQNDTNRIWQWASTERAVCSGPDTPSSYRRGPVGTRSDIQDYFVRVKVCDASVGLEGNCKIYPGGGGTPKPIGLLQKYGEGSGAKFCSKTGTPCNTDSACGEGAGLCVDQVPLNFGALTGSYRKNLSGGVLRKNIWSIADESNPQSGVLQTSENVKGNIIITLDRMRSVGFRYSDYSYQDANGGNCGWITNRGLNEGECRMWGNPVAEMMYESLRYLAGKGAPTPDFTYSETNDAGLTLSKPDWGVKKGNVYLQPYDIFPWCSKPSLVVISDVSPSYDSDKIPGSEFHSFTGDLSGLDVGQLANSIGTHESLAGESWFVGQSGSAYDFVCSPKNIANLGSIRGLCPEDPTKQGSYYSAAMAYYGKTLFGQEEGLVDVNTYAVALSSPIPDISLNVGGKKVRIVPTGKSVSGSHGVYQSCAQKGTLTHDDDGLKISDLQSDAYCPSNQIVDFYVDQIEYDASGSVSYAKFRVNFEDVEQGADHDMDAIVIFEIKPVGGDQLEVKLTTEYGAGSIDQVLGFIISGTSQDGTYLVVKDGDVPNNSDSDTPLVIASMPKTWTKTFTVTGNPAGALKDPLWYAAKWGGFTDLNDNGIPDLKNEWDRTGTGDPDNYFFVANPLKLEEQLESAFLAILERGGAAGAVATVTQEVLGKDLVIRGAFTTYEDDATAFVWKGHLEAYWPFDCTEYDNFSSCTEAAGCRWQNGTCIGGCSAYSTQSSCEALAGCQWTGAQCKGLLYSFQKPQNRGRFCVEHEEFCWDGGNVLAQPTHPERTIYTSLNGTFRPLLVDDALDFQEALANTIDFDNDGVVDLSDTESLIQWLHGQWNSAWQGFARDRTDSYGRHWPLGDIVYSTPVVVGPPSVGSVAPGVAGNCECDWSSEACRKQCFYAYRASQDKRKKVVYVGANDGMLHAFVVGKWDEDAGAWVYDPSKDSEIGQELWAYIPSNLLSEVKELAKADYGLESGCAHRFMVDLSPHAWEVYIDHDKNGQREWRTVLVGGQRGGGDVYFAIDITEPENPHLLWEYPVFRNMVQIYQNGASTVETMLYRPKSVYDQVKNLPVSWSVPYVGRLKLPDGVSFDAQDPVSPLQPGTPDSTRSLRTSSELSGWFAFFGSGARIFDLAELPNLAAGSLNTTQKHAVLKPYLLAVDIETGHNIFQYLWPQLVHNWSAEWPGSDIPYALADPLVLDVWDEAGNVKQDGYVDHIYVGDLHGNFYGLKFNLESETAKGFQLDVWKTKTITGSSNAFRAGRQPITVMPSATFDPNYDLRLYFGTGKFDNVIGGNNDKSDTATMSFYSLIESKLRPDNLAGGFTRNGMTVKSNFYCKSTAFQSGCTWTKTGGAADCCESSCPGSCWNCVYDFLRPGERVVDSALVAGGVVLFTTYMPKNDLCSAGGDAYLYALDYQCGTLKRNPFSNSGFLMIPNANLNHLDSGQYTALMTGSNLVAYSAKLGTGMPSRPVMDSSGEFVFIQTSDGQIHRMKVNLPRMIQNKGWKQR